MIQMTVNGKVVYPYTSQSIKITKENPYEKDSGTYSYEIHFPMAVFENRMAFGNIDRLEVRKRKVSYDDCKMFVGNRLVIDGKGTVTNITNTTVSMQLIEEVRKLLNVTFVFNDTTRTVCIADTNEQSMQDSVSYEPADEFSCEYDEDGLSSYLTSNLSYQFDDSADRMWWDYIPIDVMQAYDIKTFATESDATQWAKTQTEKVQKTTILKIEKQAYTVYMIYYKGEDAVDGNFRWAPFIHCGFFSPLVRDIGSDNTETINICPAAMFRTKRPSDLQHASDQMHGKEVVMPSVSNSRETEADDMTYDEANDNYYYSVQDAIETGTVEQQEEGEVSQEPMPVMFAASTVRALDRDQTIAVSHNLGNPELRYPMTYTHFLMFAGSWQTDTEPGSLSLQYMSVSGQAGRKDIEADKNNKLCVKFYTDEIPDPSLIYIFHNKRYLCEKVELNITATEISKEKTGYFYELL